MEHDDQHEKALRPASTVAGFALAMVGALLVAGFVAVGIGNGSILGWGAEGACADLRGQLPVWTDDGFPHLLRPGAVFVPNGVTLCIQHAGFRQHLLASVSSGAPAVVHLAALVMLVLLVRAAARSGPFAATTARAVGRLGWWLLLASPVATVAAAIASSALFATVSVAPVGLLDWMAEVHVPYGALITGAALLSVARLWRIGTGMRAEIEATV
jgi:Protein of unknown function (DUF2975)